MVAPTRPLQPVGLTKRPRTGDTVKILARARAGDIGIVKAIRPNGLYTVDFCDGETRYGYSYWELKKVTE